MDVTELGLELIWGFIYEGKKIDLPSLAPELRSYIEGFKPQLPVDIFPEDFPSDEGYTGDHFTLYRGFCFTDPISYGVLVYHLAKGYLTSTDLSSWTLVPEIAERFAKGASLKPNEVPLHGVIVKTTPVTLDQIFFSAYAAHSEIEFMFPDRLKKITNVKQHSLHEEEFILLPQTLKVDLVKILNLNEL